MIEAGISIIKTSELLELLKDKDRVKEIKKQVSELTTKWKVIHEILSNSRVYTDEAKDCVKILHKDGTYAIELNRLGGYRIVERI